MFLLHSHITMSEASWLVSISFTEAIIPDRWVMDFFWFYPTIGEKHDCFIDNFIEFLLDMNGFPLAFFI